MTENSRESLTGQVSRAFALLAITLLAGLYLIWRFAESERAQDLAVWEDQLNLIAASRADAVSGWLNRHQQVITDLAGDASLQLYSADIALDPESTQAQLGFVRNLFSSSAQKGGFHVDRPLDQVQANVRQGRRAGIALVDGSNGNIRTASTGMPVIAVPVAALKDGKPFIKAGPELDDGTPLVLFGAPVAQELAAGQGGQTNWIVGARPLDDEFLSLLDQPGVSHRTGISYLATGVEGTDAVTNLTPVTRLGRYPDTRRNPAAARAIAIPGKAWIMEGPDTSQVMVTGRDLSAPVDWVLIRSISAIEAMETINARRNNLMVGLGAATLGIGVMIWLAWRLGASRRLAAALAETAALSSRNRQLSDFLLSVTNSQPTAIAAMDGNLAIQLANDRMALMARQFGGDLTGQPLDQLFDGKDREVLSEAMNAAVNGRASSFLHELDNTGQTCQVDCISLNTDTGEGDENQQILALLVMQDVSELMAARKEREAFFDQLVSTLASIIDARDPWSAQHSQRLARVAGAIADAMQLEAELVSTAETAGQLMNLGKILVPREILTKEAALNDEELAMVRESIARGAGLLEGLSFDGPVADSIAQAQAHLDGSGMPEGLSGDDILVTARILAVANAFVGMVSARAHRPGLGFEKAMDILQGDAGTLYDRSVITALAWALDHGGGSEDWAHFTDR